MIRDKDGYDRILEPQDIDEHVRIFNTSFRGVWKDDMKMFFDMYVPRHLPTITDGSIEQLAAVLFGTPAAPWSEDLLGEMYDLEDLQRNPDGTVKRQYSMAG